MKEEHHYDNLHPGEDTVQLSDGDKRWRKARAILGCAAFGISNYLLSKYGVEGLVGLTAHSLDMTIPSAIGAFVGTDVALTHQLESEYESRPEEQRAYEAERGAEVGDLLLVDGEISVKRFMPSRLSDRFYRCIGKIQEHLIPSFTN